MSYDTMTGTRAGNGHAGPDDDQGTPDSLDQARGTARQAAEQGRALAGTATDHARELTGEARDQLQVVAGEARDQARRALSTTTDELETQIDERLGDATAMARARADELRALAEGRPEDAGSTRDLALRASERLDAMADRVDDLGARGVVEEVSEFARRRPLLFLAGAAGAGLLVGRLARATKDSVAVAEARAGGGDQGPATTTSFPVGTTTQIPTAPVAPLGTDPTVADLGRSGGPGQGRPTGAGPAGEQVPPAPPTPPPPPVPPQGPTGTGTGGRGF